jgi:hypothetical protein
MEQNELQAVEVGHPVTNMLMRQACAADMGAADHADAGGATLDGVTGPVTAPDVTGHVTGEGNQVAALVLGDGSLLTMDAQGANIERAPTAEAVEGVDQARDAGDELADHLLEIENLVEGARDAIVRRLEQFDALDERTMRAEAMLLRVDDKLDLLLSHFGLLNTGS